MNLRMLGAALGMIGACLIPAGASLAVSGCEPGKAEQAKRNKEAKDKNIEVDCEKSVKDDREHSVGRSDNGLWTTLKDAGQNCEIKIHFEGKRGFTVVHRGYGTYHVCVSSADMVSFMTTSCGGLYRVRCDCKGL